MPIAVRISRARFTEMWMGHIHGDIIAAHFAIDRTTVTKVARRFGLPLRTKRKVARWVIPFDRSTEFIAMWRGNVKLCEMARHFACNRKTVENHAKRLLQPLRGKGKRMLDLGQWAHVQLRHALAARAREEQAALANAEMVDTFQVARWAGRAA